VPCEEIVVRADDGCSLHVDYEGDGQPLLLIAGLGGKGAFWEPVWKLLRGHFRLVTFDHRGTGRSGRPADGYSIDRIADDALVVLDSLNIERAHVMGHSTGGAVAQTLALDAAARVEKVVISGSWARPDYRFRLLFETRLAVLEHASAAAYISFGQILGFPPDWINENEPSVRRSIDDAGREVSDLEIVKSRLRMLLRYNRFADLPRITSSCLIVGSKDDMIIPLSHSIAIADSIPGSRLIQLNGGHFFPRTATAEFTSAVLDFLR
jgi:aminoacrylate hydrolase